jgi:hypothetical protein
MLTGAVVDLNGDGALEIVGPSLADTGVKRVLNTRAKYNIAGCRGTIPAARE